MKSSILKMILFSTAMGNAFLFQQKAWADTPTVLHPLEVREDYEEQKANIIGMAFANIASKTKLRGTHSKGICANATFDVFNSQRNPLIPTEVKHNLKQGLFSKPGSYQARIRFANAFTGIQSDTTPDPRALSIAVDLGNNLRQDFVLQNLPIFPLPHLTDFLLILNLESYLNQQIPGAIVLTPEEKAARIRYLREGLVGKYIHFNVESYLTETYWSGTPYNFGPTSATKYIVVPCSTNQSKTSPYPKDRTDNYLQEEVVRHLSDTTETAACFDFKIQPFNATKMKLSNPDITSTDWIENVGLEWTTESFSVARLTLTNNSAYSPEQCDDPQNSFSIRKNTLPDHKGIGRLNRGRSVAEQASVDARTPKQ